MTDDAPAFGDWLRTELDKRGWTLAEFARRLGTWNSLISKWLNNVQRPRPAQCHQIAAALGIDPDLVLDAAGHRPTDIDAPGIVRHECRVLISRIPEDVLLTAIPLLRALADPAVQEETRRRLRVALRPRPGPQPTAPAEGESRPSHDPPADDAPKDA